MSDQPEGLPDPGLPCYMTVAVFMDGNSKVNYICPPPQAVAVLREIADSIEEEVAADVAD